MRLWFFRSGGTVARSLTCVGAYHYRQKWDYREGEAS
jgi:hypothetical protein